MADLKMFNWTIQLPNSSKSGNTEAKNESFEVITLVNEFICYNQGALAYYIFSASEKHKALKEEWNTRKNPGTLAKLHSDLFNYCTTEMDRSFKENLTYVKKYFNRRSRLGARELEARVCVKICEEKEGQKVIKDFIREEPLYLLDPPSLASNTGFYTAYCTGKEYFCNNLPREAVAERYENPRLNKLMQKHYKLSWGEQLEEEISIRRKKDWIDNKWINCWDELMSNGHPLKLPPQAFYKSTIIIPMTLLGNKMQLDFKKHFKIDDQRKRAIYGFLCVDHHSKNFFNLAIDKPIGYIFADIMSLYFITCLTYIDYSATYKEVKEALNLP